MDIDTDVSTVLAAIRQETDDPQIQEIMFQLEDYFERKLWNQLTLALQEFYDLPQSLLDQLQAKIFNLFVSKCQSKLNYLRVIDFLLQTFQDPQECFEKLQDLQANIVSDLQKRLSSRRLDDVDSTIDNDEAVVYVRLQIARHALLLGDLSRAEEILDLVSNKFETTLQNDYSSKINAAFYLTKCQYHKYYENYNLFYTNGLLFLSSIEGSMLPDQRVPFCYDLCIAALLGDKIYNFGELILHEILQTISAADSQYFWLYNLIQHLNSGNLAEFKRWLQHTQTVAPHVWHHRDFLHLKIVIMSLLELILTNLSPDKTLLFQEISSATGITLNDVELYIIKCFSLGLIKGHINQLQQVLVVTWMQPRVLNLDQVKNLYNRLVHWNTKVDELAKEVYTSGGNVWAVA